MKKLLFVLFVAVLVAGAAVQVPAVTRGKGVQKGPIAGCEMPGCGSCESRMMENMKALGLSAKQTEEVKTVHLKMKKDSIKKRADIEVSEIELRELLSADAVDMAAVEAKVGQLEKLSTEMRMMHIRTHEEVKSKLSPEQRKKLQSISCGGAGCGMGGCGMGMGKCSPAGPAKQGKVCHKPGCRMKGMPAPDTDDSAAPKK